MRTLTFTIVTVTMIALILHQANFGQVPLKADLDIVPALTVAPTTSNIPTIALPENNVFTFDGSAPVRIINKTELPQEVLDAISRASAEPQYLFSSSLGYADTSIATSYAVTSMSFPCGGGYVTIHYDTGAVDLGNASLPEAAKAFWEAVAKAYPEVREAILRANK